MIERALDTRAVRTALDDLKLDQLYVVYPGKQTYRLGKRIEVVPLANFLKAT